MQNLPKFDGGSDSILIMQSRVSDANIFNNLSGSFVRVFEKSVLFIVFVEFSMVTTSIESILSEVKMSSFILLL